MTHTDIIRAFGFASPDGATLESIYAYAPVYHLTHARGDWIVKRTQRPLERGRAVAAWTRSLAARGLSVVTPADGFGENPRAFDDEVWVVYPFIAGDAYTGDAAQITAAGELLGAIHAEGAHTDYGLKQSETVVSVEAAEIEGDVEGILEHVRTFHPEFAATAKATLAGRVQRYFDQALPALLAARLPLANCTWDYKASNLIYPSDASPVLVDADNAGRIPRAYDLAIAALLFHNEGVGPNRLFTSQEWAAFLTGYSRHVQLTAEEKQTWDQLLLCAWLDEALWLLKDDDQGWADPRQSRMLLSLLTTDLVTLALVV